MAATHNPSLTMWNTGVVVPFTPFGGASSGNPLQYFLGTPEIENNVKYLAIL